MRRLYAWLAGVGGGFAVYRVLTRRRARPAAAGEPEPDPRAGELRARLAEARAEVKEVPVEAAAPLDPDARRRLVHEQGQAALDEMRRAE